MKLMTALKIGAAAMPLLMAFGIGSVAHAHLTAYGWKDNGNGTVTMWGQHWHGDQGAPSTENGGLHIGAVGSDNTLWPAFQWTGFMNNIGGNIAGMDAMVTAGILTGYDVDDGNFSNNAFEDDWFFTDPLVIGNGTWGVFTGTNCCIDTMTVPGQFTITGVISVPDGTGPGTAPNTIPEPGTLAVLGLGLLGLGVARRRKIA